MVLDSTQKTSMGSRLRDRKCRFRNRGIRRSGAGRNPGTLRGGTVGAIVFGRTLPGCLDRVWYLVPAARVLLSMYSGGSVLSAVRALHRRRPDARYAHDTEHQHQHPSQSAHAPGDRSTRPPPHRGSIAGPVLPDNQEFWRSRVEFGSKNRSAENSPG